MVVMFSSWINVLADQFNSRSAHCQRMEHIFDLGNTETVISVKRKSTSAVSVGEQKMMLFLLLYFQHCGKRESHVLFSVACCKAPMGFLPDPLCTNICVLTFLHGTSPLLKAPHSYTASHKCECVQVSPPTHTLASTQGGEGWEGSALTTPASMLQCKGAGVGRCLG